MDILNNELFPHCRTMDERKFYLGYMTQRLIKTYYGINEQDDRDSYINKRTDLTGVLLNKRK